VVSMGKWDTVWCDVRREPDVFYFPHRGDSAVTASWHYCVSVGGLDPCVLLTPLV